MKLLLLCVLAACRPDARRFIAVGDTGQGNDAQRAVAQAMVEKCAQDGCDFVLLLGDNFYSTGVMGTDDPQWQEKFEQPYAAMKAPFWVALGNHDYGIGGIGFVPEQAGYQVAYQSKLWHMPARYYQRREGPVDLAALDTTAMIFQNEDAQRDETSAYLKKSKAPWKIAFGHHPYLSNGPHGDAGRYDGGRPDQPTAGKNIKDILEASVCGEADLYLAGHEHNLQVLRETCAGTTLIISGAGAQTRGMQSAHPADVALESLGFVYFVATETSLTYDVVTTENGTVFSGAISRLGAD